MAVFSSGVVQETIFWKQSCRRIHSEGLHFPSMGNYDGVVHYTAGSGFWQEECAQATDTRTWVTSPPTGFLQPNQMAFPVLLLWRREFNGKRVAESAPALGEEVDAGLATKSHWRVLGLNHLTTHTPWSTTRQWGRGCSMLRGQLERQPLSLRT